ncbi:MAG: helix-turn-helix domain-containing protein [Butyrivibrio sp.]|nr:helix-turn-helix domain-containing protein [Butyrivibrio sp.]
MNIKLSGNIREYRKARSLTQQKLADALGVTVGAVYKWEAALSMPDISLLIELADFFDTSVDALLGYEIKDNKYETVVAQLKECIRNKDKTGLVKADKALIRYPNSFEIVYNSATMYYLLGFMPYNEKMLRRSIELMERSIVLISQNTNPEISEFTLYRDMADIYSLLNENDKAIELLEKHNPCGLFNDYLGTYYGHAFRHESESGSAAGHEHESDDESKAVKYLSMAFLNNIVSLFRVYQGYYGIFYKKGELSLAVEINKFILGFLEGLKEEGKGSFLDKAVISIYTSLAGLQVQLGDVEAARESLHMAKKMSDEYDASAEGDVNSIRFVSMDEPTNVYDNLGDTVEECIQNQIKESESDKLQALWEEIKNEEG